MNRSVSRALWKVRGSGRYILPLLPLTLAFLIAGATGCKSTSQAYEVSPAVTNLEPPVPAEMQKQAEQDIAQFFAAVQKKDYEQVRRLMSPELRAKSPSTLDRWVKEGPYTALEGASNLQYPSMEHTSRGKKLVVHTRFTGLDGSPYRTNVVFTQTESAWRIDKILPPTKPSGSLTPAGGAVSKAPGQ